MKTSLIQIQVGMPIFYIQRNKIVYVTDYQLTVNGIDDPKLVCVVSAKSKDESMTVSATSDKFRAVVNFDYPDIYKKHLNK